MSLKCELKQLRLDAMRTGCTGWRDIFHTTYDLIINQLKLDIPRWGTQKTIEYDSSTTGISEALQEDKGMKMGFILEMVCSKLIDEGITAKTIGDRSLTIQIELPDAARHPDEIESPSGKA